MRCDSKLISANGGGDALGSKVDCRCDSVWRKRDSIDRPQGRIAKLSHLGHTPPRTTMTGCEQRFFSVEQPFLRLTLRYFKEHLLAGYLSFPLL
jgi:hypothetical protein